MTKQMNYSKPKASALSKFTAISAVIIVLGIALVIAPLFLYTYIIRSPEVMANIEDSANILTRNFLGGPLLVLDALYIGVSLVFIVTMMFIVFRKKGSKTAGSRIICVDPASSEIIEEKDLLIHRDKTVIDTSRKSILLDGENRFRGNGGFRGMTGGGFGGGYFGDNDKVDSDGDRE